MRPIRRVLALLSVVAAITLSTGSATMASETKTISMVKNCATWPTTATCTVTRAAPLGFLRGSVITYLDPSNLGNPVGTDVTIATIETNSTAPGHCRFDWTAQPPAGLCTFTSGTGTLTGFQATLAVAYIGGADFSLRGTYSFDRSEGDDPGN